MVIDKHYKKRARYRRNLGRTLQGEFGAKLPVDFGQNLGQGKLIGGFYNPKQNPPVTLNNRGNAVLFLTPPFRTLTQLSLFSLTTTTSVQVTTAVAHSPIGNRQGQCFEHRKHPDLAAVQPPSLRSHRLLGRLLIVQTSQFGFQNPKPLLLVSSLPWVRHFTVSPLLAVSSLYLNFFPFTSIIAGGPWFTLRANGEEFFTSYDEVYDSFDAMGLQENLLRGISAYVMYYVDYRFEKPSAIQQRGIMPFIKGLDVIQQAQFETKKIATFCSGVLQHSD
ncbi:hypothetical protein PIB30_021873 [Stylosanthes scabra]|uniref:DEAD-box RNA helicase Q domain-containing protein n=1 Tax=Stylosanthes scabra TaxID=79078 RepID=A0ABU6R998_9FABA|nr:hypothetical protein [Stylosanthes scabra]